MELKLNCTAQRMLGRCRLRLKTTTAQGAWVVRPTELVNADTRTKMKFVILVSTVALVIPFLGCRPSPKYNADATAAVTQMASVTLQRVESVTDARLGPVASVSLAVNTVRTMKKAPKLVAWTITDQKGEVYRFFDFPDGKGGTRRTAIYVRGLEAFDYAASSNVAFNVLFPIDQIPTNAGSVFLAGEVDVGLPKPEAFRIQVR